MPCSSFSVLLLIVALMFVAEADAATSAFNLDEAKQRCRTQHTQSKNLYRNTYHWGYSVEEMQATFAQIYTAKNRLPDHAEYNEEKKSFFLYYPTAKSAKPFIATANFIKSVTLHIETVIEKGYASYVFFPDMGHAHLYFPLDYWQKEYAFFDDSFYDSAEFYEKVLADEHMRPLYHLSEQLQMIDGKGQVVNDDILRHKYRHRNFFAKNNGTAEYEILTAPDEKSYNTVSSLKEYMNWSAGFVVSANALGCFPYHDKDGTTRYFDISIFDPGCDPALHTLDCSSEQ